MNETKHQNIEDQPTDNIANHVGLGAVAFAEQASQSELVAQERKRLIENYDPFQQDVENLFSGFEPSDVSSRKQHDSYLASGLLCDVYRLEKDGTNYAVKIPRSLSDYHFDSPEPNQEYVEDTVIAATRAKGVPHLEQVVAVSLERGVIISEFIPGVTAERFTDIDRQKISDAHLRALAETFREAHNHGVIPELENPGNLIYDPEMGFNLVDYDSVDNELFKLSEYAPIGEDFDIGVISRAINFTSQDPDRNEEMSSRVKQAFESSTMVE